MFPEDRMLEVLIIGALALIVIGPKDLPIAMRKLGRLVGRLRAMAAEFRASFDELARQSELEELRKEVEALRAGQDSLVGVVNPLSDDHVASTFSDIHSELGATSFAPPMSSQIAAERAANEAAQVTTLAQAAEPVMMPKASAIAENAVPEPVAKPKAPRKPRAKAAAKPAAGDDAAPAKAAGPAS